MVNKDQIILEEMVDEIIQEVSKHGKKNAIRDILQDAADKGFIRFEMKNSKWFIYSLKDNKLYTTHLGETGVTPIKSFLRKLGWKS